MKTFNDSKSQHLEELEALISSSLSEKELEDRLSDYHDNDIAEILEKLTPQERLRLYRILGVDRTAEIFAYLDDAGQYMEELSLEKAANVVSHMDSDDAVDVLEDMDESRKAEIVKRLDHETSEDVKLLWSYDDDEIGSCMTTNYICIHNDLTIRQAMRELIRQAGENDNISTIYVVDEQDKYYGAIDLKDLIVARDTDTLESIISRSYPYLLDNEKTDDCVDRIKEYAEDSLPVLTQEGKIAGIITSSDVVEMVDDAMGDDYAKLGGLTAEEDLKAIRFNLNVDVAGAILGHDSAWCLGPQSLEAMVQTYAAHNGIQLEVKSDVYSSDEVPFSDQGIPSVSFMRFGERGANYIHNRHDVLRYLSPESLEKTTKLVLNFLDQLDQSAVFPIERMIPEDQKKKIDAYLNKTQEKK